MALSNSSIKQTIKDSKERLWGGIKHLERANEIVDGIADAVQTEINAIGAVTDMLVDATTVVGGLLDLREGTDNGANRIRLQSPATLASDRAITFPDADVDLGDIVSNTTNITSILPQIDSIAGAAIRSTPLTTSLGVIVADHTMTDSDHFASIISADGGGSNFNFDTRTAAEMLAEVTSRKGSAVAAGDTWDLTIINIGATNTLIVVPGADVTPLGDMVVAASFAGIRNWGVFRHRVVGIGIATEVSITRVG